MLEHAIAYLNEFRVRFNVGVQFLCGVRNRSLLCVRVFPPQRRRSRPSSSRASSMSSSSVGRLALAC
jgi:hypothetical protein